MVATGRAPIRVVGRYALYNEIAAGGMATIHLGRLLGPVGFARTVAVKRLHPQFAKDPEFVSMFLDEARLAARVQHPNVVATIDVVATDGELFLIMDYVRGESLSKILRTNKRAGKQVPPRIAAAIMCGFLHGLHAAHEAKDERGEPLSLVHRDVSPQNVLVGSDGISRALDFGIAKAAGRIQVTREGQIKGKLSYMPPEQLAGRPLTRSVDIYASAVVMWETLTGDRLFKGATEKETLSKIMNEPIAAPSSLRGDLPKGYDEPLLRALSRHPVERQATARELALEIEGVCGIASPTEVGEWVEATVGQILTAREEQIAQIESSSVGMAIPDVDGDSSVSARPSTQLRAALAEIRADYTPDPPLVVTPTGPRVRASGSFAGYDDPTGPMRTPPVAAEVPGVAWNDRRLLVFAAVAVLLLVIGLVSIITALRTPQEVAKPVASSPVIASVAPQPTATESVPEPVEEPAPPPTARPKVVAPTFKPVIVVPPPPKSAAPVAPKKNCDPPYTIDANGRKKYKLDCM